jgi:membrane protease YdiL (CAAX protease family)
MKRKTATVAEVTLAFAVVVLLFRAITASRIGRWENQTVHRLFIEYAAMLTITLVFLALTRRNAAIYGVSLANSRLHLGVTVRAFFPMFVVKLALFLIGWEQWLNAAIVSAIIVGALVAIAWLVRDKTGVGITWIIGALLLFVAGALASHWRTGIGRTLLDFVGTFLLVAPAEELLFRGYIQSRLNEAFGRPRCFFGVNWGWGLVGMALLFGLWHVLIPFNPFTAQFGLAWTWGLWTFFGGLLFGFIREKTGSLVSPALLHGVMNF